MGVRVGHLLGRDIMHCNLDLVQEKGYGRQDTTALFEEAGKLGVLKEFHTGNRIGNKLPERYSYQGKICTDLKLFSEEKTIQELGETHVREETIFTGISSKEEMYFEKEQPECRYILTI